MEKAIAYYRVSTRGQGQSGLGLEAQRAAVLAYIKSAGLELLSEHIEIETGTGKRARPKLAEALGEAKKQGAVLVIAKLDRLSRNVRFICELLESKVAFVALDCPQANSLTVHLLAALAEYEARLISTRTREALKMVKARGKRLGNPQNLTAEGRARGREVLRKRAQESARKVAGYVTTLRQQGYSLADIAERLNNDGFTTPTGKSWHPAQVGRVIARLPGIAT